MWRLGDGETTFFTRDERRDMDALFEEIVPGDATRGIPGASEAGAGEFLDRLLARGSETYFEIPEWATRYREGLRHLSDAATAAYGRVPADLTSAERLELLEGLSRGALDITPGFDQRRFFELMRRHCIQGCFADPRWGGNKDLIMWRWYGYLQPAQDV